MTALPDPRERPWISIAEAAEIFGEGEKVIRAACEAGQLPVLRIGRYVRIPTHQLLVLLGMPTTDSEPVETELAALETGDVA